MTNVHVGIQIRREPAELVKADESEFHWDLDIDAALRDGQVEFRGPSVQGVRGERFVYLTWGEVHQNSAFEMFRRAKLMLNRIDPSVLESALEAGHLRASIDLTGSDGGPRCGAVKPPAIVWSVPAA